MRKNTTDDIVSRIEKSDSGCWIWPGATDTSGYGIAKKSGRMIYMHRFMWELENGKIPAGMCACHKCDVRRCCNPSHIFIGTRQDNIADMYGKGRGALGERRHAAKLTDVSAAEIKLALIKGEPKKAIARRYGVSPRIVYAISKGATWKHVEMPNV